MGFKQTFLNVRITFEEEYLSTANSNPEIYREYIASKAPDATSIEEEVETIGVDSVMEKSMTVFPREDGKIFLWNYYMKGFFKEACGVLARIKGEKNHTLSSKLTAYRKIIDGLIFVTPRKMFIKLPKGQDISTCQRPIRTSTAKGEFTAIANSECIPIGSSFECEIGMLDDKFKNYIIEWLDYGQLKGLGCWRNSGKGAFQWTLLK